MNLTVADPRRPARPESIGRYRILDRIGKGGMGVVYAAYDDLMSREVAVKVLIADPEGEPDIRTRFLREAQVCLGLAHQNIVTVFDVGEDDGRLFIVMELLHGQTLADCLKQRTLTVEEKVDLILQVCDGLAAANAAGVCHRDVKPANLFLQQDGVLKIVDFGIARLASSSMTASGFIVGTPDYMSPEQARGAGVDERSDIFSAGAVLYFMLAGRKPFDAQNLPAVLHKVVWDEPPPLDEGDAPAGLGGIVSKALAKAPADRFQAFAELAAELTEWRRQFDAGTRLLADEAARRLDGLIALGEEERSIAATIGVASGSSMEAWLVEIADGHPLLLEQGAGSLRGKTWHRTAVEEVTRRIAAVTSRLEPQVAGLRTAEQELRDAAVSLDQGDARGALTRIERVLARTPAAADHPLVDRARRMVAEQQAREDRVASLLAEAGAAKSGGRLDAALSLATNAVDLDPANTQATQLLEAVQRDVAAERADRQRRCERSLERARRALQMEHFEEAERQLQRARGTGAAHPDIAVFDAALSLARTARDAADAAVQEIAGELTAARSRFLTGDRGGAIGLLEALAERYPSSTAAGAELERLRTEDRRLADAERALVEADRLAGDASAALGEGDAERALNIAEQALLLIPSHEAALRTAAMAGAHVREVAERAARITRAAQILEGARTELDRGRFDQAIREARRAAELDPMGTAAPALIAQAFRRQTEEAAEQAKEREAARRSSEVRALLDAASEALRAQNVVKARELAERAMAVDPAVSGPRDLLARIATAVALAVTPLEDDTVSLGRSTDPEATVALRPVAEPAAAQPSGSTAPHWLPALWSGTLKSIRSRLAPRPPARTDIVESPSDGSDPPDR